MSVTASCLGALEATAYRMFLSSPNTCEENFVITRNTKYGRVSCLPPPTKATPTGMVSESLGSKAKQDLDGQLSDWLPRSGCVFMYSMYNKTERGTRAQEIVRYNRDYGIHSWACVSSRSGLESTWLGGEGWERGITIAICELTYPELLHSPSTPHFPSSSPSSGTSKLGKLPQMA